MLPFRIKICGVKTIDDALLCAEAGADAIGLNFYGPSRRSIDLDQARAITRALPDSVSPVGLFVNAPAEQVNQFANELKLQWVQLHGDEPPEFLNELDLGLSIMRAYRFTNWRATVDDLELCQQFGREPDALLIDANVDGSFGGTGETADWQALAVRRPDFEIPILLAGGLTPANVAEAIEIVRPWGVDTASGVELAPGMKDSMLVDQFVAEARGALNRY